MKVSTLLMSGLIALGVSATGFAAEKKVPLVDPTLKGMPPEIKVEIIKKIIDTQADFSKVVRDIESLMLTNKELNEIIKNYEILRGFNFSSYVAEKFFKKPDKTGYDQKKAQDELFKLIENGTLNPFALTVLKKAGADINEENEYGETPLMKAVNQKNAAVVQMLIKNGADVNKENKYDETALILAIRQGSPAVVQVLVKSGADINKEDKYGGTALSLAKIMGRSDIFTKKEETEELETELKKLKLEESTAQPTKEEELGFLSELPKDIEKEIIAFVVGEKDFITAAEKVKGLAEISEKYKALVIEALKHQFFKGAPTDAQDELFTLSENGTLTPFALTVLLGAGADLNMKDNDGYTALMLASFLGNTEIAKMLIDANANLNMQYKNGNTALMFAISMGNIEAVKALIEAGANPNIRNYSRGRHQYGESAWDVAMRYEGLGKNREEIIKIIKKAYGY